MNNPNPLKDQSFDFAIEIFTFSRKLKQLREYEIANQILRSGTSIGANIEEAIRAHTKKDFAAKISISHKEAGETDFWLRLLIASDVLKEESLHLRKKIDPIIRMLCATTKTIQPRVSH